MKIDCEVIKDLLPLYIDGACSNKSKEIIEEHIRECNSCKKEFQLMNNDLCLSHVEKNLDEAKAIKKISKEWKKGMLKALVKGILITAIFALIFFIFMDVKVIPK